MGRAMGFGDQGELRTVVLVGADDPVAGDLAAYLAGRYRVLYRRTSGEAEDDLDPGTAAVVLLGGDSGQANAGAAAGLVRRAITQGTRVVVLGSGGLGPGLDGEGIVCLPALPDPKLLLASLNGSADGAGAAAGSA